MSRRQRRKFTPEDKAAILRRHLADKIPVSDLCEEYKLQPSVFYQWQRQLFDPAAKALEPSEPAGQFHLGPQSGVVVFQRVGGSGPEQEVHLHHHGAVDSGDLQLPVADGA